MIRIFAQWWARKKYVFREEMDAALKDLNASAAQYRAGERREAITKLTAEADAIEASIKEADAKMAKGFWLCECGRDEPIGTAFGGVELEISRKCGACQKDMKLIRTDLMTGQEKYEAEKERKEAQQMADANRKAAADHEEQIKGHEDTAAMFRKQAQQTREFADLLRKL